MTEKRFFSSDDLTVAVNVLSSSPLEDGTWAVITDATLFHPQGGGQAGDKGRLGAANVLKTVFNEAGDIVHITDADVAVGPAEEAVDAASRLLNSRLHTAGHLIAEAGAGFGWHAYKGDHRAGESRVVFKAPEGVTTAPQPADWQPALDKLIAAALPRRVTVENGSRSVTWGDLPATHCGGTHVKDTSMVSACRLTKMKLKKCELSVSYTLDN